MAAFLQWILVDVQAWNSPGCPYAVGGSDSPSCAEEEQNSLNAQRHFELKQPVFFVSGKRRQGNLPCWKLDFSFLPSSFPHT